MTTPASTWTFGAIAVSALSLFSCSALQPHVVAQVSPASWLEHADPAQPDFLRAEILHERGIHILHAEGHGPRSLDDIQLTDFRGDQIALSKIVYDTAQRTLIVPKTPLDKRQIHYVTRLSDSARVRVRFDGWFRTLYSDKPLGATVVDNGASTHFGIFAPRAQAVAVNLYGSPDLEPPSEQIPLQLDSSGVWSVTVPSNLHGTYYEFEINQAEGTLPNTSAERTVRISDPYARVNAGSHGRSRVWAAKAPPPPRRSGPLSMEDLIAYEVHPQDFTDQLPESTRQLGPFRAMVERGLWNASGEPIGFDYLTGLGINAVHLMPVQEYLHHPDTEWRAAFGDDPRLQALGIASENYQWGYRTTHAFAIENRYGAPNGEPGNERAAFRDLVAAFHAEDIAVIVDIVPNHTGENMDGAERILNFNGIDKAYYYRTDDAIEHIGPFGNEVKTEDRPMVQRWIIDQCLALVEEFGVDGFRIDLAGQIDEQTLIALKQALGSDILIYGEPWIDVTDPYIRANKDWDWYKEDSPITFFQDDARNALKGSPFELSDKMRDRGFAGGNASQRAEAMAALTNDYAEESESPNQGLNYLDIHDNWALADRFATANWDGLAGVDEAHYRIAAGLLMTSQGPIVLHGGSEIMRSKGLAPLEEWHEETPFGDIYFKGRDDTYNLRTPNQFVWETVGTSGGDGLDYAGMEAWWAGLIALRNNDAGKVFRRSEPVPDGYYEWILPENEAVLGYVVDQRVLVLANVGNAQETLTADMLPEGSWVPIAAGDRIDLEGLAAAAELEDQVLPAKSFAMWIAAD